MGDRAAGNAGARRNTSSPLASLPDVVFHTSLAPHTAPADLLALSLTCRALHHSANAYWRRELRKDIHCPERLRRDPPGGLYSRLYFGLRFPRVFSWGPHDEHLLGGTPLTRTLGFPSRTVDVLQPVEVTPSFVRYPPLISVLSVGQRLIARGEDGSLWEWDRGRAVPGRPSRVWMGDKALAVAGCSAWYAVLDAKGQVWAMERHGVGQRLIAVPTAVQVSVAAGYLAVLTVSGDIWVRSIEPLWDPSTIQRDPDIPTRLRSPPRRQDWTGWESLSQQERCTKAEFERQWQAKARQYGILESPNDDGQRIVHIAAGWQYCLALKANGEVWLILVSNERWEFLPSFSRPDNTSIEAGPHTFAVFSSEAWPSLGRHFPYKGCNPIPPHSMWDAARPDDTVISLTVGSQHWVALSNTGKVYSWGSAEGSLLGRLDAGTDVPAARIRFADKLFDDDDDEPFVFAIAGSAALALGDGLPPRRRSLPSTGSSTPKTPASPSPATRLHRLLDRFW